MPSRASLKRVSRSPLRLTGRLVRAFHAAVAKTPGIETAPSPWTRLPAFFLGGREIAHFQSSRALDFRLTQDVIRRDRDTFRRDPRFTLRPNRSHWVLFTLRSAHDLATAADLFQIAVAANASNLAARSRA
jgi:hypothetical protein